MTEEQFLDFNKHISNEEILKDIEDTEAEIRDLETKRVGHTMIGERLNMLKASYCKGQIRERRIFIDDLKKLLELRKKHDHYSI